MENNIEKLQVNEQDVFTPFQRQVETSQETKDKFKNLQTINQKIEAAEILKQEGNQYFKDKNYKKALSSYHKIILYLNGLQGENDEFHKYAKDSQKLDVDQKIQINILKQAAYLNMSQCQLNQKNYEKAFINADLSNKIMPTEKSLFRRGVAAFELGKTDIAEKDFEQVKILNPTNDLVDNYLKKIKIVHKQQDQQLAKNLNKMFA